MSKKVLLYALKVWLTSLLLGPVIYFAWSWSDLEGLMNFFDFTGLAILFGFFLSLPCALGFWGGVAFLRRSTLSVLVRRLVLCAWAALLTAAPFWLLYVWAGPPSWGQWLQLPLCCWVVLVAGIFSYRFPA